MKFSFSTTTTAAAFGVILVVSLVTLCESGVIPSCPQNTGPHDPVTFLPHTEYCSKYYMCVNGEPMPKECPLGTVWNDDYNTCVHAGSHFDTCTPANAVRECERGTMDLIPHPTACQLYYNCSSKEPQFFRSPLGDYVKECPYPQLFDLSRKMCVHFTQTTCNYPKKAATWECDYEANKCRGSHCIPCKYRYPSCVGKSNGFWADDARPWSPYYVECYYQRSQDGRKRCPQDATMKIQQFFHPVKRQCVSYWETPKENGGEGLSCDGKAPGLYQAEGSELIQYKCPGTQIYYCNPPLFVDNNFDRCVKYATIPY